MARTMHFTAYFLLGCIASSSLSWLGSIHAALFRVMWFIYGLVAIGLILALLLDDAFRPKLKLSETDYYALLIAVSAAVVLGGVVRWLVNG
ncbi:hypothetical protein [Nostoc linckia]|uniref:hypothetical protein n=1 Tax=Nostoc linckia TaxID=92942 RepID=UPI000BFFD97A|nr:hypothetical protein [Nostoc linckia]PHJ56429.1 hypothetical protein VF03_37595 [Nostoc linckia z2]